MRGAHLRKWLPAAALLLAAALFSAACVGSLAPRGGWASPVEHEGNVYVTGGIEGGAAVGNVIRVDADSGRIDSGWIYPALAGDGLGIVYSTPVAEGDSLYVAGYSCTSSQCASQVAAISTENARPHWVERSIAGTVVGPLALAGSGEDATLLVGTGTSRIEGGSVTALNPADEGAQRWRLATGGDVWGGVTVDDSGGVGYFGTFDGTLYAIDLDPGFGGTAQERVLWQFDTGAPIVSRPALDRGFLYFGNLSDDANLFRLDLSERAGIRMGSVDNLAAGEWAAETGAWVWASPLPLTDRLVASNVDGELFAVDLETGMDLWEERADLGGSVISPPEVSRDDGARTFYAASQDGVFLVNAGSGMVDGASFDTGSGVAAMPLLAGDRLYVHTLNGRIMAFSPVSLGRDLCREIRDIRETCN